MIKRFVKNMRLRQGKIVPQHKTGFNHKGANATELKYLREVIKPDVHKNVTVVYEPPSLIISKTTAREYTADYLVSDGITRPTYHEVKGSYTLPTEDRARLAWEIAAEHNPEFDFVWAKLTRRGWEIERWSNGGRDIIVHTPDMRACEFVPMPPDWRKHRPRKRRLQP